MSPLNLQTIPLCSSNNTILSYNSSNSLASKDLTSQAIAATTHSRNSQQLRHGFKPRTRRGITHSKNISMEFEREHHASESTALTMDLRSLDGQPLKMIDEYLKTHVVSEDDI